MKKYSIVLLFLLLSLFPSCKGKEEERTSLVLAVSQDIPNLDVQKSTGRILRDMLVGGVYERLFVPSSDGTPMPELAESWEFENNGHVLSVELRGNKKFSDGTMLESRDVVKSLERWVASYGAARSMLGVHTISETADGIRIESENNISLLPYMMATSPQSPVIMTEETATRENRFGLVDDVVGTGPYKIKSFESGSALILEKNEYYEDFTTGSDGLWGRKDADWETIEYRIVPESTTRRIGLERGEYDYINEVMSEDMETLGNNEDIRLMGAEESGSIALVFNKKSALGSNREFRRAVSLAIDKDDAMKACYGEWGYDIHSDYMEKEQSLFACTDDPYAEKDTEKAKEHLRKSGYDGEVFTILTSNLSNMEKIAYAVESDLEKIGINTEVTVLDWTGFLSSRKDSTSYDMFVSAFSTVALPQMKLYLGEDYPGWYEDGRKDEIMDALNDASSIGEAAEIWQHGQEYFWSEVPVIVPGHYKTINGVRSDIEGVIQQDGTHFWRAGRK